MAKNTGTGFNFAGEAPEPENKKTTVQTGADTEGLVFDLDEQEEPSFEVIPAGTYPAIVEEMEYTTSQSSGLPMLSVVYTVTEGEFEGRKVFDYYVLSGPGAQFGLPKLKQLIVHTCPEVSLKGFNPAEFAESGVILNRECTISLKVTTQKKGEYKGQKRNQVKEIGPKNSGSFM